MNLTYKIFNFPFIVLTIKTIISCAHRSYKEPYDKGVVYASQGSFEIAKKEFNKSLEINRFFGPSIRSIEIIEDMNKGKITKETAALIFMEISNSNKKLYDQAINDYSRIIEKNPKYARVYELRGGTYFKIGEYGLAIKDYNTAIEIDSVFTEAYVNRGVAYAGKGQYELAIQDYQKAIEINPSFDLAYVNLGFVNEEKKLYEQAIKNYTSALDINSRNAEAYYNRGNVHHSLGSHDLAIKDYNKAIEIKPGAAVFYSRRGYVHLVELGHEIKGCLDLQKACKLGECENYDAAVQRDDC